MVARTNRLADLLPLTSQVPETLSTIEPRELIEVGGY